MHQNSIWKVILLLLVLMLFNYVYVTTGIDGLTAVIDQ